MWLWHTLNEICQKVKEYHPTGFVLEDDENIISVFSGGNLSVLTVSAIGPTSRAPERCIAELVNTDNRDRIRFLSNINVYVLVVCTEPQLLNVTVDHEWAELICFSLAIDRLADWPAGESVPCVIPKTIGSRVLFLRGIRSIANPYGTMLVYCTPCRYVILFLLADLSVPTRFDIDINQLTNEWLKGLLRDGELHEFRRSLRHQISGVLPTRRDTTQPHCAKSE